MRGSGWVAFAATVAASLLTAIVLTLATGWGGDDLGAFFFWTLPFGGILALLARRPLFRGRPVLAAGAGAAAGIAWTVVVALLLGPYVLAFGFAIWLAWLVGGAAGLVVGAARPPSPRLVRAARIGTFAAAGAIVASIALASLLVWAFDRPDVVAHLRDGTSFEQASAFASTIVGQRGVVSVTQNDPLVLEIDLADGATDDDRRRLRDWLEDSPLVARVDD